MIYLFTAKPELWRLAPKMKPCLILGLTLIIAALAASTAAANPAYQSAGEWRRYPTPARVTTLVVKGDVVWVGTPADFNQNDGTSVTYTTADGLTSNDISTVAIDPEVGAWDGNISYFDGQAWQAIRLLEASEDGVYLSAIAFDSLGQLWYGVYGVEQSFERGWMLWWGDSATIIALPVGQF